MLPCGMGTLLDKQLQLLSPTKLTLWVRPQLAEFCKLTVAPTLKIPVEVNTPIGDEPTLLTTGRTLHFAKFEAGDEPSVVAEEGNILRSAVVKGMSGLSPNDVFTRSAKWMKIFDLPHTLPQGRYVEYVWDLIAWNEESLIADFVHWQNKCDTPRLDGPWHVINPENVCMANGAKLSAGCVLDATKGPIVIDAGAAIGANAVIEGPCYIGQYSRISPLANIRGGTTVGAVCKLGGEVSNSIISNYSNKPHEGFLGDSFVGAWVNLGAGSTTSNLKNTYGEVKVRIGQKEYGSGQQFLGSMIGDHTKVAIGTRLNTGSYIGYCSMLAGAGMAPKFVPSFSFWTNKGLEKYELNKAIEVAGRVMDRRDKQWTSADESIMRYIAEVAPKVEGSGS
jgi:UDP-N-acetylglucosamine diphosphorylase / glucose-1-phosphate thymidylyltransferase / UDP-N-acetylgalactosamine diphosphorylase / glucosamine-1-phosphate N-acetyltransferase / galactosamine-1-phosphate N-acetyltransferase